jgi:WD40 repeat protein
MRVRGVRGPRCTVVVWDFVTRQVARQYVGHVETVTSVSWSRNSRRLLSSSQDFNVILWDVPASEVSGRMRVCMCACACVCVCVACVCCVCVGGDTNSLITDIVWCVW